VWNLFTGQKMSVLKGHTKGVNTVAISPDGKTIVSGSCDFTVR
jgi:WD40 repeat protein